MKLCRKCGVRQPLSEFHRRGSHGKQAWCKTCRRAYDHAYHTQEHRLEEKRRRRKELNEWYRMRKGSTPCADCGGLFHHAAMQWDHPPGAEKVCEVSTLFRRGRMRAFRAELAKCELVCANCHAVRSFERASGA